MRWRCSQAALEPPQRCGAWTQAPHPLATPRATGRRQGPRAEIAIRGDHRGDARGQSPARARPLAGGIDEAGIALWPTALSSAHGSSMPLASRSCIRSA
jgi:hypothetical protein